MSGKDELLQRAARAQAVAEEALHARRVAFQQALHGPVSVRELSEITGVTPDKIRGIIKRNKHIW